MPYPYAVFTVMLPELTPEEAAAALRRAGYDGVEWRVTAPSPEPLKRVDFWSGNRCTVDIDRLAEDLPRIKALCEAEGLRVPALGTYLNAADTERIRACMEFAQGLDCSQLRVGVPNYNGSRPYPELFDEGLRQWEAVEKLAAETGVRANLEMHMGNICPSAGLAHRFVSRFDPRHVGVIYDPGNMKVEGYENWQMGMELLGPYLAHVHAKNVRWDDGVEEDGTHRFKTRWCAIHEGVVEWDRVLAALEKVGYAGWISFEDFSNVPWQRKLDGNLAYLKRWTHSSMGEV